MLVLTESRSIPKHRKPWAFSEPDVETYEETKLISSPLPINYVGEHRYPGHEECCPITAHNQD
jgi:hypothetical protein